LALSQERESILQARQDSKLCLKCGDALDDDIAASVLDLGELLTQPSGVPLPISWEPIRQTEFKILKTTTGSRPLGADDYKPNMSDFVPSLESSAKCPKRVRTHGRSAISDWSSSSIRTRYRASRDNLQSTSTCR